MSHDGVPSGGSSVGGTICAAAANAAHRIAMKKQQQPKRRGRFGGATLPADAPKGFFSGIRVATVAVGEKRRQRGIDRERDAWRRRAAPRHRSLGHEATFLKVRRARHHPPRTHVRPCIRRLAVA